MKSFLLFFFTVTVVFSQEGEIEYKTVSLNKNINDSDLARNIEFERNRLTFSLRYNKRLSFFQNIPHVPNDDLSFKIAKTLAHSSQDWYQTPIDKKSYYNKKIAGKEYLIITENQMQGWEPINESKYIKNYKCYKAILRCYDERNSREYNVVAWYTTDIPIPYGPAGYGGLSGLILELRFRNTMFIANRITLNPNGGIKEIPKANMNHPIDINEQIRLMRKSRKVTVD